MKIVYERAAEEDKAYIEELKQVINKIHEKFNSFGNEWVKNLKNNLPYETEYNNWEEAIEYANKLFIKKK